MPIGIMIENESVARELLPLKDDINSGPWGHFASS
jgi:hypothetical protein